MLLQGMRTLIILLSFLEEFWVVLFINYYCRVGAPDYLSSPLVLVQGLGFWSYQIQYLPQVWRGDSAHYRRIRLWNVLPSTTKSSVLVLVLSSRK
jgi:hypothetical protein